LPSALLDYFEFSRGVWPKGPTAVRERVKDDVYVNVFTIPQANVFSACIQN
jgi:hypothetical protein